MNNALETWLDGRTRRDRTAIGALTVLIALSIAYVFVWLPVSRERDRLLVRVPELRADAQAMERDTSELDRLKPLARPTAGLTAAIQQAVQASGLSAHAADIVQRDPASTLVTIASVRTEGALNWIARLQSVPGVRVESLRLASIRDGDLVNVYAVLVAR